MIYWGIIRGGRSFCCGHVYFKANELMFITVHDKCLSFIRILAHMRTPLIFNITGDERIRYYSVELEDKNLSKNN